MQKHDILSPPYYLMHTSLTEPFYVKKTKHAADPSSLTVTQALLL